MAVNDLSGDEVGSVKCVGEPSLAFFLKSAIRNSTMNTEHSCTISFLSSSISDDNSIDRYTRRELKFEVL